MKNFLTVVITASMVFGCNNKPANDEAVTLKFNLQPGMNYEYDMDMNMSMKGNVSGQNVDMHNTMATGYHFKSLSDSAGWKKMQATISHIAMNINSNGQKINYDSDKPGDTLDVTSHTMAKVLGTMKDAQFYFNINSKGEVGSVSGIDDMMQHAMSSVNSPAGVAMASGVSSSFNEDNFKQNLQQSFNMYPDKPVKPGDTWTNATTMSSQGTPMKMDNTYTLQSVTDSVANIKVDSKITSPGAGSAMGLNGTMTGTMKFDIPTGIAVDGDLDMNINMSINTGGQLTPMTTDIKMKITGKKS